MQRTRDRTVGRPVLWGRNLLHVALMNALFCVGLVGAQQARKVQESRWLPLWSIGGTENDSLLVGPSRLVTDGRLVYVVDAGGPWSRHSISPVVDWRGAMGRKGGGPMS